MLLPPPPESSEHQPTVDAGAMPSLLDGVLDPEVLDLHTLPPPLTAEEHRVHTAARASLAALADVLARQEAGESVSLDTVRLMETEATEYLLAYKRLLATRAS